MSPATTVRAKFKVDSIARSLAGGSELTTVHLSPVFKTGNAADENNLFWKWTPSGKVELGCINPEAAARFELGKEYYLDFTPAFDTAPKA